MLETNLHKDDAEDNDGNNEGYPLIVQAWHFIAERKIRLFNKRKSLDVYIRGWIIDRSDKENFKYASKM